MMDHHPLQEALRPLIGFWIFSALIQTMPKPLPMERWYGWLFSFAQIVGANIMLLTGKGNAQSSEGPK